MTKAQQARAEMERANAGTSRRAKVRAKKVALAKRRAAALAAPADGTPRSAPKSTSVRRRATLTRKT